MQKYDYVIAGNSAAGLNAMRTLRYFDKNSSVAVIDRENEPAYSRVLTPYYVGDKIKRDALYIVDKQFYRKNGIDTFFGKELISIVPERNTIGLSDGTELIYGKLLLATGGEAKEIKFNNSKNVLKLRHFKDADRMNEMYKKSASVVGFGAGLVTIPLLSHLRKDIEKHLVISSDRIFSRVVDRDASEILEKKFASEGLTIHKKDDLISIEEKLDKLDITLKSGSKLTADMVIVGKGVEPNIQLADEAGIDTHWGIMVDKHCRTNVGNIFAAGDVAECNDFFGEGTVIQGNWLTAAEQGDLAARNMLGYDVRYEGSLKNNTTEVFGTEVAVVGYFNDDVRSKIFYDEQRGFFRKIFLDESNTVIGATMIGETNDAGIYYGLVKRRAKLNNFNFKGFMNHAKILKNMDYC
ncbi:MAG: NAD(P)/FAD-dependent oxidoreductase [Flexistipes sinusarabici]|uniref:NAD(P)/FAD-dependent oxidoreductase n=1 Tax=Flexistipes sinusarabici TaxID=2352 RepID=A0A5D0MQC0_FLESI|nr:FAD-dependent oxidoreductase [Flexistipes sinusarabici]TYB33873.1 MAG: NAD(P)/FAD-dependent oxidoreductase [Flexistipes sinusarabici]